MAGQLWLHTPFVASLVVLAIVIGIVSELAFRLARVFGVRVDDVFQDTSR